MNPKIAANQQRRFLEFLGVLRPHVATDAALPRRIKEIFSRDRAIGSRDRRLYRELLYTALRHWPWVDGARQRGDGQTAGLAPTAGSEAGGARSAGAHRARDEQPGLLDTNPDDAAKLTAWLAADGKSTSAYRAAHCGDWPAPEKSLSGRAGQLQQVLGRVFDPQALLPPWFKEHCPAAFEPPNLDVLHTRAPLWVRLQVVERSLVLDEFRKREWPWQEFPGVPDALNLPPDADVGGTDAHRRGFVEIQDLGSQLVLLHAPVQAGQRWLDACAGAGGKTLQLAHLVGEKGRVDAADIRAEILDELRERASRARLANVRIVTGPSETYDGVLVDAPCSGSGTWRRSPHLKWVTTPEMIAKLAATQLAILSDNAARVGPGGVLVYATCSLSSQENQAVVAAFLLAHQDFTAEPPAKDWGGVRDEHGTTLMPAAHDTDGFYIAVLRRKA